MADQKLSALSAALVASANDLFYMVTTGGVSQKIPFSTIKTSLAIPVYVGTGNKFIMTDTGADTVSSFRLVQSGNSITVTTANNKIIINALTGNLSGKQDSIAFPLSIGSGGTGKTTSGNYAALLGVSDGLQYFAIQASDNVTIVNAGTSIFISATTNAGGSGVVYAATGNKYVVMDLAGDLTGEFRLVQSGNSISITTATGLITINAVTGNLSTKQDTITYPLGINSGGTGLSSVLSATNLIGFNSSDTTKMDSYRLVGSDNVTIVRVGTGYFFSANTGTGASTSGIIYAPTGGFYVAWSADNLLASEKVLTASNNITITTDATAIYISANTGAGGSGSGASTANTYVVTDFTSDLSSEFRLVQSGNSITINTAGNLIIINAVTGGGSGTIQTGSAHHLAFYPSAGTTVSGSLIRINTGSGVASFNLSILTSAAASSANGDVWFQSSSNKVYLFTRSNNANYFVVMNT